MQLALGVIAITCRVHVMDRRRYRACTGSSPMKMYGTRRQAWATCAGSQDIFVAHNVFYGPLYIPGIFVVIYTVARGGYLILSSSTLYGHLGYVWIRCLTTPFRTRLKSPEFTSSSITHPLRESTVGVCPTLCSVLVDIFLRIAVLCF